MTYEYENPYPVHPYQAAQLWARTDLSQSYVTILAKFVFLIQSLSICIQTDEVDPTALVILKSLHTHEI